MKVIVDTSVWSEFFRRSSTDNYKNVEVFKELVVEGRVVLLGVVKQELLSGIRESPRFTKLLNALSSFDVLLATDADHILAATYFNSCRSHGVQGSYADFLICAQAANNKMSILSSDGDFMNFKAAIEVNLWSD